MADALASGASVLRDVGVQVPLRPQARAVLRTATHEVTNQKWFVTFAFGGVRRRGATSYQIRGVVAQIPIIGEARLIDQGRAEASKGL